MSALTAAVHVHPTTKALVWPTADEFKSANQLATPSTWVFVPLCDEGVDIPFRVLQYTGNINGSGLAINVQARRVPVPLPLLPGTSTRVIKRMALVTSHGLGVGYDESGYTASAGWAVYARVSHHPSTEQWARMLMAQGAAGATLVTAPTASAWSIPENSTAKPWASAVEDLAELRVITWLTYNSASQPTNKPRSGLLLALEIGRA